MNHAVRTLVRTAVRLTLAAALLLVCSLDSPTLHDPRPTQGEPMETVSNPSPTIVRTESAGVFFGLVTERSEDGTRAVLRDARRIWYWDGAATLSELGQLGTSKPKTCRFPAPVDRIEVLGVIEVLPVTQAAAASISAVPVWTEH